MRILKFGGTSVGSAQNILQTIAIIQSASKKHSSIAVVCSAFTKVTDALLKLATTAKNQDEQWIQEFDNFKNRHLTVLKELNISNEKLRLDIENDFLKINKFLQGVFLLQNLPVSVLDELLSFGERLSNKIITQACIDKGLDAYYVDASKLILTDNNFGQARFQKDITYKNIVQFFSTKKGIPIITGFIGANSAGEITTLGRGGSDLTGSIVGAALRAEAVEIWTDVSGMLTADPRIVRNTKNIAQLSYREAMEMSHFGAKVIYPPSLQPAMNLGIPIFIKNTFSPNDFGTKITQESPPSEDIIRGISSINQISLLRIEGGALMGSIGMMGRVSNVLAENSINIIFLTQGSSEYSICLGVSPADAARAKEAIEQNFHYEMQLESMLPVEIEIDKCVLAIIGENMRHAPGVAAKLFSTLSKNGINVSAIAQGSSELNISIIIDKQHEAKALNALHESFFLKEKKNVHIFLVGYTGLIGKTLFQQIIAQQNFLQTERNLSLKVIGISNSNSFIFDENGIQNLPISPSPIQGNLQVFISKMKALDLPNTVFVDCSAGKEVMHYYADLLLANISVVTPNKNANSSKVDFYQKLHKAKSKSTARFCYETNVGAGLPVINTLQNLLESGDKILKIEAVLSGTLSYIFNEFKGEKKFSEIVLKAKELGFTEPDPRDDLSGLDVAKKCLILGRECGLQMDLEEIKIENLVPEKCQKIEHIPSMLETLKEFDSDFEKLKIEAQKEEKVLRYLAIIENGKASVKLTPVAVSHPFGALSGSDNMIVFTTERYKNNPLVVRGPGAGAEVTAAGVFAEIITLGNYLSH